VTAARILVVEDDEELGRLVADSLSRRGMTVSCRRTAPAGLEALDAAEVDGAPFDVVVTDLNLPGMNGLELCDRVVTNRPDLPVVVITAFGSLDTAVAAIRAGAYDFVTKPFDLEVLHLTLERAVRHRSLTREVVRLRRAVAERGRFESLLGDSDAMRAVYDLIARVAASDATVLITGESGTGKELTARAVHARSARASGPFVAVNCAAIPEALLESELFGHVRGAFTDARTDRAGLFVRASGGTLFLDEIGELPLALQPTLLRAIQERMVRPVGADREVGFDARLVAATTRDLATMVEDGRFRDDLYYRLDVVRVTLPPLRERGRDVLVLAQAFLERFAARSGTAVTGLTAPAADRLLNYRWPGNVRELANCIERAVALARTSHLTVDDLPERIRAYRPSHVVVAADSPTELVRLDEVERRYILHVLDAVGGSRTEAARILGVDRKTLYRRLRSYGADGSSGDDE